jgi:transposase
LGIAKIQHELREIVNAILYVNRTGIAWEYLPHDFPPYKTVHGYFALWEKEGITEAIHDALRGEVRRAAGRSPEPTAAILDAQTVKTSGNVPEHSQGIDAGHFGGCARHDAPQPTWQVRSWLGREPPSRSSRHSSGIDQWCASPAPAVTRSCCRRTTVRWS